MAENLYAPGEKPDALKSVHKLGITAGYLLKTILPTSRISNEVFAVNSRSANYFIYTYGSAIIGFDTGTGLEDTVWEFAKIGISPDHVTHIFLTHSDANQTAGMDYFKNAQFLLSSLEEPMARGRVNRFLFSKNSLQGRRCTLLHDREVVRIAEVTVTAISTPGHTPGSMSYLVNGTTLFTGEAVQLQGGRAVTAPWWLNTSTRIALSSLHTIAQIRKVALLCTAASGTTSEFSRVMRRWDLKIMHCADRRVNRRLNAMIMDLLGVCFPLEPKFKMRRYYNEPPAFRWFIREGKKLVAHLATHVKQFEYSGTMYGFYGISEVAVRSEYRGRGLVGRLLEQADEFHKDLGYSILMGEDAVYRRYGYERMGGICFPDESKNAVDKVMVKCRPGVPWPAGRVEIRGKYF